MRKKLLKYIIGGFVFLGIGFLIANFQKNSKNFLLIEYILSSASVVLLLIAPFFLFPAKLSKYVIWSILATALAYIIIIILYIFRSNFPSCFEEVGVAIVMILHVLFSIFLILAIGYTWKKLVRMFKNGE